MPLLGAFLAAVLLQATPEKDPPAKAEDPWQDFCCYEKGRLERDGLVTIIYQISHKPAPGSAGKFDESPKQYAMVLTSFVTKEKGKVDANDELGILAITDTPENITFVEKMFRMLHRPAAPVMIEAKVVELEWDSSLQIGIDGDLGGSALIWSESPGSDTFLREIRNRFNPSDAVGSSPFQGSVFRFGRTSSRTGSFGGLIQMFAERGKAKILSQPKILVKANTTAKIFAGEHVPIPKGFVVNPSGTTTTFEYKPVGVNLEVTPQLAAPGMIMLKLKPEVSNTFGFLPLGSGNSTVLAPQFNVRSAETELLVRDEDEVVIGGLYRSVKNTVRRGIPFLSDIPIIGILFGKYEEQEAIQEILFYIKPTIIKTEAELPREDFDPADFPRKNIDPPQDR